MSFDHGKAGPQNGEVAVRDNLGAGGAGGSKGLMGVRNASLC